MKKTITDNTVDPAVLTYTVGEDPVLDLSLAKWDCMGTAAHVTMLSEMKGLKRPIAPSRGCGSRRRAIPTAGQVMASADRGGAEE